MKRDEDRGETFYGWVSTSVSAITNSGRKIIPDPVCGNPYHAVIQLPPYRDKEEYELHLKQMTLGAYWIANPLAEQPL